MFNCSQPINQISGTVRKEEMSVLRRIQTPGLQGRKIWAHTSTQFIRRHVFLCHIDIYLYRKLKRFLYRLKKSAFHPEFLKWDQNLQFLPLSEMANMPLLQYGNSPLSRGESAEWVLLLSQLRVISVVACVAGSSFSVCFLLRFVKWLRFSRAKAEPRSNLEKKDGEGVRGERSEGFLSLPLAPSTSGFPFYLARPYKWKSATLKKTASHCGSLYQWKCCKVRRNKR